MSDGPDLIRAICTHPDEDTPRLAYADWLDEHDQPNRAEFIRVQIELAGMGWAYAHPDRLAREGGNITPGPLLLEWRERKARERELLEAYRQKWTNIIPGYTIDAWSLDEPMPSYAYGARCQFRRGFVDAITCTAANWLRVAEAVYWHPGQTVACPECKGQGLLMHWCNGPIYDPCPRCPAESQVRGTGRVPRSFVATAHPITKVALTTRPTQDMDWPLDWVQRPAGRGELSSCPSRWPTIVFEMLANDAAPG